MLVPLTNSLYCNGTLGACDKVMVDIGTGYIVEKSPEKAKEFFGRKREFCIDNINKVRGTFASPWNPNSPSLSRCSHPCRCSKFWPQRGKILSLLLSCSRTKLHRRLVVNRLVLWTLKPIDGDCIFGERRAAATLVMMALIRSRPTVNH